METPALFDGCDVDTSGPWGAAKPKVSGSSKQSDDTPDVDSVYSPNVAPQSTEWETYRLAQHSDGSVAGGLSMGESIKTSEVSFDAIRWAIQTLRFRIHVTKLFKELAFHGNFYVDDNSSITYNDLLQGLVNMTMGTEGLTLEEQMKREADADPQNDPRFRLATWARILEANRVRLLKQVEGAKMNPNTTDEQLQLFEKDLESVEAAILEMQEASAQFEREQQYNVSAFVSSSLVSRGARN
jgi:hypothetical protein